jgi:pimeloyl-ACP methyl ester carboxylesterase
MSISEALGEEREVKLPQGTIRYRERGEGQPLVFVHGLLVNGDLWRKVVPRLTDRYRCITPDWPLGSHAVPVAPEADLTPTGLARMIADFLEALDLRDVTLVGNDTGTGLSQIAVTEHPERIGRIVLTTGDAFNNFPPMAFKPLVGLGYVPPLLWLIEKGLRPNAVRRLSLMGLAKTLKDPAIFESYAGQAKYAGIRRDVAKVLKNVRPRYTRAAAEKLPDVKAPALIVWAPEDKFFPNEHAYKLADLIPDARVVEIQDSFAFVSEDQPERTADAIGEFLAAKPVGEKDRVA